ncbi:hypothetical protein ILUMI_04695 [Ignelater luminosus]|uniref:Uncharacterized protein n=1 Tax=Ignelater luminosus TaxID=2038154 RepID=A0A8K0DC12_IGNLU|nr:hypothetical protein ILUMI_04695 [Ignelater luminosus]
MLPPEDCNLSDADLSELSDNEAKIDNMNISAEEDDRNSSGVEGNEHQLSWYCTEKQVQKLSIEERFLLQKEGRGSYHCCYDEANQLVAVKLVDNKVVTLASSFVGGKPLGFVKRWNATEKCKLP